jgi:transposase
LYNQFIKSILPLPSFFTISMPSDEEPAVFPVQAAPQCILCPICFGKTYRHDKTLRRFRHSYAWHIGTLWIELEVPRQRCKNCDYTFTYDYDLGLVRSSTLAYRLQIVDHCHGRAISDVAREFGLPYTTVERWFYTYAPKQLTEEKPSRICVDEFALRKGHTYATSVLNADTGHVLAIVPGRDEQAIQSALSCVEGTVQQAVSDLAPAMAKAIQRAFPSAIHVLDPFHLIQLFTDALKRRRRYLNEAKKHYKVRFIDRCLACDPATLTEEERGFVSQWLKEDKHVCHIYQSLQHIRYVFKAKTFIQAKRRFSDWIKRFQFHTCGAVSSIVKALVSREKAILNTILSTLSNGMMEGTNNKIKLIKRRGYGYRNNAHLFLRIRLETGGKFVTPDFW